MGRLNILLILSVISSALYLVHVQYESRRLFVEMEKVSAQGRVLQAEQQRLLVEKRAEATSLKIEKLAVEKLQMRTANPAITHYVTSPDSRPYETEPDKAASSLTNRSPGTVRAQ